MSILKSLLTKLGIRSVTFGELNTLVTGQHEPCAPNRPIQTFPQMSEAIEVTDEYKTILELLESKCPVILVTGKAGSGKSTLVHWLRTSLKRNLAVVAPTGVAALNAGGVTIHSFCRFPPRIIQDSDIKEAYDRRLYQVLDLLIIDEVSMVRCDIIDGIDKFLRKNRYSDLPFGGVQLLLVGDFFQLPPVTLDDEEEMLRQMGYSSEYFFSAFSLQTAQFAPVELKSMFRQKDDFYIDLLNNIRTGEDLDHAIQEINNRCCRTGGGLSSITLTCTNAVADQINKRELKSLPAPSYTFEGSIEGDFRIKRNNLPSPFNLELKEGARVMFTKNGDSWVNGSLGIVRQIDSEKGLIKVELDDDAHRFICTVGKSTWEQYKYRYDHAKSQIIAEKTGGYTQYPLALAWAVTIHKSQGKTLDNVLVDFGHEAFEYGQVYVALSRCRSIDGIRLQRPLLKNDVKCDPAIRRFYDAMFSSN